MSKSDVFHLGLTKNDLQGATLAIVPGDPERVEKIAALMEKPVKLASHREFTSWRAELDGKSVIVCSTGIGGPSTSIAVEELAQLGIRTFLHHRVMTLAADRQGDQFQTTLANHLDLNLELTVNTHSSTLATFEDQLRAHLAGIVFQRVAQSLETGQRHLPFEGNTAIGEFARINVRWNRSIRHRRSILGMHPAPVKGISALSAHRRGS